MVLDVKSSGNGQSHAAVGLTQNRKDAKLISAYRGTMKRIRMMSNKTHVVRPPLFNLTALTSLFSFLLLFEQAGE
jgi:hypothetical protein